MNFILPSRSRIEPQPRQTLVADHPELDQPDGDLTWEKWLEGLQRLETALLITES